jgi:hypothetical protein
MLKNYIYKIVAKEISTLSNYYDSLIQLLPLPHENFKLFDQIQAKIKKRFTNIDDLIEVGERNALLLNGVFNHHFDIEKILIELKEKISRGSRVIVVLYNPYLKFVYHLANFFGFRKGEMPTTFITEKDLDCLTKLSGFELVRLRPVLYFPFNLLGLGNLINKVLPVIPLIRNLALVSIAVLRPIIQEKKEQLPTLSIIIPARNEKGNIENGLKRIPSMDGVGMEVIFVEGHSGDGTYEEIKRILILKQEGKGKADAVRLGFQHSECDLLTILDADLTMPPELLPRFYNAYIKGYADFINGSRLVYPMEGKAMRFLNLLGNKFFAKVLGILLDRPLGDSLCGTKLFLRSDYKRFVEWRKDFGDFDPFGDFELIFPAAILGLGIIDIPIRYKDRTYGSTQISRFRHGFMLLKMTAVGFFKIKMGNT